MSPISRSLVSHRSLSPHSSYVRGKCRTVITSLSITLDGRRAHVGGVLRSCHQKSTNSRILSEMVLADGRKALSRLGANGTGENGGVSRMTGASRSPNPSS